MPTKSVSVAALPPGAHADSEGRIVDRYDRLLSWDASGNRWLSLVQGAAVPSNLNPDQVRSLQDIVDCPVVDAKKRTALDTCGGGDDGGAIAAPVPATVTNLTANGSGNATYSDQNGNQWSYCYDCSSPDDAGSTKGEWLQQIGQVQGTYIGIAYVNGFEDLSMAPFLFAGNQPPTAYKNYPSLTPIYFNVNHFWKQHLACHLLRRRARCLLR